MITKKKCRLACLGLRPFRAGRYALLQKLREEELDAKYVLEKLVYKDRRFLNTDKPDLRDEKGEIGVEHRLVTTRDAMLMEKFLEETISADPQTRIEGLDGKTEALLIENEVLKTGGSLREPRWKIKLLEMGVLEKLKKLNEGEYALFARNELFLTMREYAVTDGVARTLAARLPGLQAAFPLRFDRLYLLAAKDLYVIENGEVKDRTSISGDFLREMEENTRLVRGLAAES
jgi:hypothetical protein